MLAPSAFQSLRDLTDSSLRSPIYQSTQLAKRYTEGNYMKATQKLHDLSQSLWLDNITRDLLTSCGGNRPSFSELCIDL